MTSCGSEAYKACKKDFAQFEKSLNAANSMEELSQAGMVSSDFDMMSDNEKYKMKEKADELQELYYNKYNQFAAGAYTFSTKGDTYKIVLENCGAEYKIGGNAILYKNGVQIGTGGGWQRAIDSHSVGMCFNRDLVYAYFGTDDLHDQVLLNVVENSVQSLYGGGLGLNGYDWQSVTKE